VGAYLQEFIDGSSMSAQYLTAAGRTELLGVTEQLVGEPWLHARAFAYCGNIGPAQVSAGLRETLSHTGDAVARWARLRGVWGVDFILRDGLPYPVDVNPRYTAGLEVIEHGYRFAALADHIGAFTTPRSPTPVSRRVSATVGKAIYFAPRRIVFPASGPWDADIAGEFDPWRVPGFADLPNPGDVIEPCWPVLTFFATGSTTDECRATLVERAAGLDGLFDRAAENHP
jgi:predicted ATP-grasp superfamily ATP-dependent carboligase